MLKRKMVERILFIHLLRGKMTGKRQAIIEEVGENAEYEEPKRAESPKKQYDT